MRGSANRSFGIEVASLAGLPENIIKKAKEILLENEIEILVCLNAGSAVSTAWGCDLTYDYVKINGDYRT